MVGLPAPSKDTIAAIATPSGRGGVGVVRISGRGLEAFARQLTGQTLRARHATLSGFLDTDGRAIDEGLALYFPGPHSFTGEDVLELQGHGGPVVMQLLLARCVALGARLARPGEFTERAFLNGKLDLAQAEAVADLIDAATEAAARSAVRSLQGEFSGAIAQLADTLVELRALTEATLDFPDEEVDFLEAADAFGRLQTVRDALDAVFARARQGNLLRGGLHVVLAGQPNAGKSSLLNRLAGDELAIVTPIPGTTRDALRGTIQVHGIPLHIVDTAGLRDTDDEVERLGIERTWKEIARADVIVLLADARSGVTAADQQILDQLPASPARITVFNKIDLAGQPARRDNGPMGPQIYLSARDGQGVSLLEQTLLDIAGWQDGQDVFIARERHLQALNTAREHLQQAAGLTGRLELFAEELRAAHQALQQITGEYTPDDLLGDVFSRFCIGK